MAVKQLRLLRPELIVNVGDLIEGGDADREQLNLQWDTFDERANRARAPVFYVGGNHDLTGVELRQIWDERYGKNYYHFIYRNVLCLVTVSESGVDIANLRLSGIFDKTGKVPLNGDEMCFEGCIKK